jgi:hypothetical protein
VSKTLKIIEAKKSPNLTRELLVYYPYLFSEWTVEYKQFIGKPKTAKRFLMTNLVKGETHYVDYRLPTREVDRDESSEIIPAIWTEEHALEEGREFLRRYYLHNIRSWKVPVIEKISSQLLYLPYEVYWNMEKGKQQLFLYEYMSETSDKLSKYTEIDDFMKQRGGVAL